MSSEQTRAQVFTEVVVQTVVFRVVTRFGGTYFLHLQGRHVQGKGLAELQRQFATKVSSSLQPSCATHPIHHPAHFNPEVRSNMFPEH
jgi:hypothetical protein